MNKEKSPIINIVCMNCGKYYSEQMGHECEIEEKQEKE